MAQRLLRAVLPAGDREEACQELEELFRIRVASLGRPRARVWYWRQVPDFALRSLFEAARFRLHSHGGEPVAGRAPKGRWRLMTNIGKDLLYALRGLQRNPGFVVAASLTLALGIGANVAIFSVVDGVLLSSLPYPNADRLVRIFTSSPPNRWGFSTVDFQALQAQSTQFDRMAAYSFRGMTFSDDDAAEPVIAMRVTSEFFSTLGVDPVLGRTFALGEDRPEAEPTVVVSHGFWERFLDADPASLGKAIRLDSVPYRVIGVLAPSLGPVEGGNADLWPILQLQPPDRRGPFFLRVVARLSPSALEEAASQELVAISRRIFPIWQSSYQNSESVWGLMPLREFVLGGIDRTLYFLMAAVGFVLLIASANVANLMLARSTARSREMAVRSALGASSARLVRHLLSESALLAGLGGAAGLVFGAIGVRLLTALGPRSLPRVDEIRMDGEVLAFALAASLLSTLLFSLAPIAQSLSGRNLQAMQQGGRGSGGGSAGQGMRAALVVLQFALAMPLVMGAGLMANSFSRLVQVDPGFDPRSILTLRVALPPDRYPAAAEVDAFWHGALPAIERLPGVQGAALNDSRPPQGVQDINNFDLERFPTPPGGTQPTAYWLTISPGYFQLMGMELQAGRLFDDRDRSQPGQYLVVDEVWARKHFGSQDPVGMRIRSGGCLECPWETVIGVVSAVKYNGLQEDMGAIYVPHLDSGYRNMFLIVSASEGDPARLAPAVRALLAELDPQVALSSVRTGLELMDDSTDRPRYLAALSGLLGALALTLAVIGIYGALAYFVAMRRTDIGIRMALGGDRRRLVGWVLLKGMRLALAGMLLGAGIAWFLTRFIASLLYEVTPRDPATFVAVSSLLAAVALLACLVPAQRASAVDPASILRQD